MLARNGFSTVEALIALVVFSIGALGAAGAMALAWRAELAGEGAAEASRAVGSVLDSLRTSVVGGNGRCDLLSSGSETAPHRVTLSWSAEPSAGGREIYLSLAFPALAAPVTD